MIKHVMLDAEQQKIESAVLDVMRCGAADL
jgi:hypothetical protein